MHRRPAQVGGARPRLIEPQHEVAEGVALERLVHPHGDGRVGQLHHRRPGDAVAVAQLAAVEDLALQPLHAVGPEDLARAQTAGVGDRLLEGLLDGLRRTMQAHDRVDAGGDQLHALRDHTGAVAVERVVHGAEVVHHPVESRRTSVRPAVCAPAGCAATGRCSA